MNPPAPDAAIDADADGHADAAVDAATDATLDADADTPPRCGGSTATPCRHVVYDANGGSGAPVDTMDYVAGDPVTVASAGSATRAGYVLTAWNTAADGSGTEHLPGSSLTLPDGDVTLFAVWTNAHPSIADEETRVFATPANLESAPPAMVELTLTPTDALGDSISVAFKGCSSTYGNVALCVDVGCTSVIDLDCSTVYDPSNTPLPLAVALPIRGRFTTEWTGNVHPLAFTLVYFSFTDDVSPLPPADTAVLFDARSINRPVRLEVNLEDVGPTVSFQVDTSAPFRPELEIVDADNLDTDGEAEVEMILDPGTVPGLAFDRDLYEQSTAPCPESRSIDAANTHIVYRCSFNAVNAFLGQFALDYDAPGEATLEIRVSDRGSFGRCETPVGVSTHCPTTDSVVMSLTGVTPSGGL